MKTKLIILFLIFSTLSCLGQDTLLLDFKHYKETSISIGYNYSFAEPNELNYHLIETRVQKQIYGGRHPVFSNISSGFDIGLNTSGFLIGPRIGAIFGMAPFFIGSDLAYYTDSKEGTLRFIPMIGFGYHQFRLSINPHIRITNKNYEPIDRGHLNFTVKLFKINKQERK